MWRRAAALVRFRPPSLERSAPVSNPLRREWGKCALPSRGTALGWRLEPQRPEIGLNTALASVEEHRAARRTNGANLRYSTRGPRGGSSLFGPQFGGALAPLKEGGPARLVDVSEGPLRCPVADAVDASDAAARVLDAVQRHRSLLEARA